MSGPDFALVSLAVVVLAVLAANTARIVSRLDALGTTLTKLVEIVGALRLPTVPRADPEGVLNARLSDVQTRRFAPPMRARRKGA